MDSTVTLAGRFETFARETKKIANKATAVAVTSMSEQSQISQEIAALADMMTSLSVQIASTLRASVRREQEAA